METKKISDIIPGVAFTIHLFDVLTALKWERKINLIFLPAVGGFLFGKSLTDILDLDANIDFKSVFDGFITGLEKLSDIAYEDLIMGLLSKIQVEQPGKPPQEMNRNIFNDVFKGNLISVYKLIFEVMKANRFSFFVLVEMAGGLKMSKTDFLKSPKKIKKK